jgi:VanZ family protein
LNNQIQNILFRAPAFVWGFLLFYFTLLPSKRLPQEWADLNDKIFHVLIFFIWTSLILLAILRYPIKKSLSITKLSLISILVIALGGLIEILQHTLVTGRRGDWWDFLANSIGTLLAALLWSFIQGRRA